MGLRRIRLTNNNTQLNGRGDGGYGVALAPILRRR